MSYYYCIGGGFIKGGGLFITGYVAILLIGLDTGTNFFGGEFDIYYYCYLLLLLLLLTLLKFEFECTF
jgi:hypothetical protein